jgi:hypothetical protein
MAELQQIVSIRRNPLYDDYVLRREANAEVLDDAQKWCQYDQGGILEFIDVQLPWLKDSPSKFYCSELINHYCLLHSDGKMTLRADGRKDDDVSPYGIQVCPGLQDLPAHSDQHFLREMDYVVVNGHSIAAWAIRLRTAGLWHAWDYKVSSHAGLVVRQADGQLWLAEMLPDGGPEISSLNKYPRM